jgi:hypothetical protein
MKNLKVTKVNAEYIEFENGVRLLSEHSQDCCESHYLNLSDLKLEDFDGLTFDLSNDDFFKRVPDYGIELIPTLGFPVRIAGNGYNNGYYSSQLDLVLTDGKTFNKSYDITECQTIEG